MASCAACGWGLVIADDAYLRDSMLMPKKDIIAGYEPIMPSYQSIIDDGEIEASRLTSAHCRPRENSDDRRHTSMANCRSRLSRVISAPATPCVLVDIDRS